MKYTLSTRNTLLLASIGVVLTLLTGYVFTSTRNTYNRNLPYVKLGDYLKNSVTKTHALFETGMGGDDKINFQKDVGGAHKEAKAILEGVLEGRETPLGKFKATENEDAKAILKESIINLENYSLALDQRWQTKGQATVIETSTYDSASASNITTSTVNNAIVLQNKAVDESYDKLQLSIDQVAEYFTKKVESDTVFLTRLSWFTAALVFVVFAAISYYAFKIFRKNEKAINEGNLKLEEETQRVSTLSTFIEAISTGDYSIEIESTDDLSNKLIDMRDKLRNNAEEDKRRNWATSGEAQIGEILRASGDISELYDNIITFVVKYTKSNQGGLFLLNDENEQDLHLELVSCYAFERKKFIKKRVDTGQGLVGQCYMEGARIHLREIPDDYVHITSGLGGASPTSLLVIPMKVNGKTYGVIEIASFKKYEEHEIVLIEKFAESIGAEVSSVKINDSTRILLEKTQQQTEEMRAQEEEMRQNMEELEATQEEMRRKEKHVQDMLDEEKIRVEESKKIQSQLVEREKVLGLSSIVSEANAEGTITYANEKLAEVSRYSIDEMMGQGHNLFRHPDMPKELFKLLWDTLKSRKQFRGIVKNKAKDGTPYWVDATIVPVYENGIFVKYISARYHITDDRVALELYNKQATRLGHPILS